MRFLYLLVSLSFFGHSSPIAGAESLENSSIELGGSARVARDCAKLTLFEALEEDSVECLFTAAQNMNLEEWDREGNRPLHRAAELGNLALVKILLRLGADLNSLNQFGETPKKVASLHGRQSVYEYLDSVEQETERLFRAIDENNLAYVKGAIARGAALGARDIRMDTPLHVAAHFAHPAIAQVLLNHLGGLNRFRNYLGNTPLAEAVLYHNDAVAQYFLEHGADPNILNERRESALDLAFAKGNGKLLILLQQYAAKPGRREDIPLDFAIVEGEGGAPLTGHSSQN